MIVIEFISKILLQESAFCYDRIFAFLLHVLLNTIIKKLQQTQVETLTHFNRNHNPSIVHEMYSLSTHLLNSAYYCYCLPKKLHIVSK